MWQFANPSQSIASIGNIDDNKICLACAAINLSQNPLNEKSYYTNFLSELSDAVYAYYIGFAGGDPSMDYFGRATQHDIIKKLTAIRAVVFDQYKFKAIRTNQNPQKKTDFCSMLDKKFGTPINLAILCMHLARSQGWDIEGIAIPGHFICRLDSGGERIIFDPYRRAKPLNASDLRKLVKKTLGKDAELKYKHYIGVSNRSILIKLQNNSKNQHLKSRNYRDALRIVKTMQEIDPEDSKFLYDAGILYSKINQAKMAITILTRYIKRAKWSYKKKRAIVLRQQLMQQR
jgi:regulator of sirC expression with transglutaminase-like and TPR domain